MSYNPLSAARHDLRLVAKPVAVTGVVKSASTGEPLAGATVLAWAGGDQSFWSTLRADDSGRYTVLVDALSAREINLESGAVGHSWKIGTVQLTSSGTVDHDIVLESLQRPVRGRVTDAETGDPVQGVHVRAHSIDPVTDLWSMPYTKETDANGEYEIFTNVRVEAAEWNVAVQPAWHYHGASMRVHFDGTNSQEASFALQKRTVTLSGRIVDSITKAPISTSSVTIDYDDADLGKRRVTISSKNDGTYTYFDELPPEFEITVSSSSHNAVQQRVAAPDSSPMQLDFELVRHTAAFNGTVFDQVSGKPIAGANLTLVRVSGGPGYTENTVSGKNGSYEFALNRTLPAGDYETRVSSRQYADLRTVAAYEGQGTLTSDIALRPLEAALQGTVRNAENGSPVEGAAVWFHYADEGEWLLDWCISDERGRYWLALPAGAKPARHEIGVWAAGYFADMAYADHDGTTPTVHDIQLRPFVAAFTGRVTDSLTDAPLKSADVKVTLMQGAELVYEATAYTDQEGVYLLSLPFGLESSEVHLMAVAHEYGTSEVITGFDGSSHRPIDLQLPPLALDSFEPDGDRATAATIAEGETQRRTLSPGLDGDVVRFEAKAGVTYHIWTDGPQLIQTDTMLRLYQDGPEPFTWFSVAENDDWGSAYSKVTWTAAEDCTAFINVNHGYTHFSPSRKQGEYSLSLSSSSPPEPLAPPSEGVIQLWGAGKSKWVTAWMRGQVNVRLSDAFVDDDPFGTLRYSVGTSAETRPFAGTVAITREGVTPVHFWKLTSANRVTMRTVNVHIDNTPPVVQYTGPAPTPSGGSVMTLKAHDTGSGVEYIAHSLNGADWERVYSDMASVSVAPGTHQFRFRALDRAGNMMKERTVGITVPVVAPVKPATDVAGSNRIETAVKASQLAFPNGADTVVIATGNNWPDALGGTSLAGTMDGPILLVDGSAKTAPKAVTDELARLKAKRAIIVGGTAAVSTDVEHALKSKLPVTRIAGSNRYDTANRIAKEVIARLGHSYSGKAFVATGGNFPDALAVAPIASAGKWPLFLSDPANGITPDTKAAMAGVKQVVITGGEAVVSEKAERGLKATYPDRVTRIAGVNRFDTAARVATYGVNSSGLGLNWDRVGITTGANFPDALAGGVVQGKAGSVMLLTAPTKLDPYAAAALEGNKAGISTITYFGGDNAVSKPVKASVSAALK